MRGVYTATIEISSVSAAKTLMLLECPSDSTITILAAYITNSGNDSNEQLNGALTHVTTKGSPVGTSVTPEPREDGDSASGATATGNLTTEPTAYDGVHVDNQGFSNLGGYRYEPMPEERPVISPSDLFGLQLVDAPATAFKCHAQIIYQEVGG